MTKYKDSVKGTGYRLTKAYAAGNAGILSFLLTLKLWKIISKNMASKKTKRCMKIIRNKDFDFYSKKEM